MWMAIMLATATPQAIFEDRALGAVVTSIQPSPDEVLFTSLLPDGWSFKVLLDGDQDGKWGVGTGHPKSPGPTSDRSFGLHADGKSLCVQHILTASTEHPDQAFASTDCGAFPSRTALEFGDLDKAGRRPVTIRIPSTEVFGTGQSAKISVCVWNTERMTCQYRLADLYVLTRS